MAYVLGETHGRGEEEVQALSIWVVEVDGGKPRRLTRGKGNSYHPRFSRDGTELLFLSTREQVPQLYAIPLHGGEPEQLTDLPQGAGPFEIAPDGRFVAFVALASPPAKASENQHKRIDRFWYRFDPLGGYLADVEQTVFLMTRGRKPRRIVEPGGVVLSIDFSPDSRRLALLRTGLLHHRIFEADLSVVELGRRAEERPVLQNFCLMSATWNGDGTKLLCTGPGQNLAYQTTLFVVDAVSGHRRERTRALDLMVGTGLQIHVPVQINCRVIADPDSRGVYTTVTRGGEAHVNWISLTGSKRAEQLDSGEHVCHLMAKSGERLLVIRQSFNEPPALHMLDGTTGEMTQLSHHNDTWRDKYSWPDIEHVFVNSRRGVEVEGWVMKPRHVRAPYKTVLTIHGGPHLGYGCSFWSDMHELVGAGYAVAYMNPRGSTGYGDEFCRSILGRWGDPEVEDFSAFLDEIVERGITNSDRLGVTGISGGGHLSAWLIGHTNRFKAAVPEQGVYSMISMWGTSDAGRDLLEIELGGEPHKMPMTYWKRSPIAHVHKCRTPTLLLQGENDIRCPMEQAEQLFAKLHHHGCEVELIPMKRCSHGEQVFGRPPLRRYRMNVLRDWFDKHL